MCTPQNQPTPPPDCDVIVRLLLHHFCICIMCVVQSQGQIFSSGALALRLACDKIMTLLIIISAIGTCKRRDTCRPPPRRRNNIIIAAPRDLPAWLVRIWRMAAPKNLGRRRREAVPPRALVGCESFLYVCVSSWSMLLQRFDSTTKINYNLWERCAQHTRPGFAPKRLGPLCWCALIFGISYPPILFFRKC